MSVIQKDPTLVAEAKELGLSDEEIARFPSYQLETRVQDLRQKRRFSFEPPLQPAPDTVMPTPPPVAARRPHPPPVSDQDDVVTVVDMGHKVATTNPMDEHLFRRNQLQQWRQELLHAIQANSEVVKTMKAHPNHRENVDIIQRIQNQIQLAQGQLEVANREIEDIHQWLEQMKAQQVREIREIQQRTVDLDGSLAPYLEQRIQAWETLKWQEDDESHD